MLDWVKLRVTLAVGSVYSTKEIFLWGQDQDDWGTWSIVGLGKDNGDINPNLKIYGIGTVEVDIETIHYVHVYDPVWKYQTTEFPRSVWTGFMYCGSIHEWV